MLKMELGTALTCLLCSRFAQMIFQGDSKMCFAKQMAYVGMQAVLVRISARLLKKTLTHTDERAKLEGELLDGVDVVKCMTWEVMPSLFVNDSAPVSVSCLAVLATVHVVVSLSVSVSVMMHICGSVVTPAACLVSNIVLASGLCCVWKHHIMSSGTELSRHKHSVRDKACGCTCPCGCVWLTVMRLCQCQETAASQKLVKVRKVLKR